MRAVIVELKLPALPPLADETKTMAENIGYEVGGTLIQRRKSVHHSYTIGPGRLKDLKLLVEETDADTVIFANAAHEQPRLQANPVPWRRGACDRSQPADTRGIR